MPPKTPQRTQQNVSETISTHTPQPQRQTKPESGSDPYDGDQPGIVSADSIADVQIRSDAPILPDVSQNGSASSRIVTEVFTAVPSPSQRPDLSKTATRAENLESTTPIIREPSSHKTEDGTALSLNSTQDEVVLHLMRDTKDGQRQEVGAKENHFAGAEDAVHENVKRVIRFESNQGRFQVNVALDTTFGDLKPMILGNLPSNTDADYSPRASNFHLPDSPSVAAGPTPLEDDPPPSEGVFVMRPSSSRDPAPAPLGRQ